MPMMARFGRVAVVGTALLLVGACASDGAQTVAPSSTPAQTHTPYAGYPSSLVAIGHSLMTGFNSDPSRSGSVVRSNSWATGTNPAVDSLYLRILVKDALIKDRAYNFSKVRAKVSELAGQVASALALNVKPDLVVIQIGENDLTCPQSPQANQSFLATFSSALEDLVAGSPSTRIFVVSLYGSPTDQAKVLSAQERQGIGGSGPCDHLDPEGRLVPQKLAALEAAIHGLESQLEAGCKRFAQCRYDLGAVGRIAPKRSYYAGNDLTHLSIQGNAHLAGVVWDSLKRAGLMPE